MWQPIETAPKDGKPVLLYVPKQPFSDQEDPFPFELEVTLVGAYYDAAWRLAAYDAFRYSPTHWMPLPPPPQETLDTPARIE